MPDSDVGEPAEPDTTDLGEASEARLTRRLVERLQEMGVTRPPEAQVEPAQEAQQDDYDEWSQLRAPHLLITDGCTEGGGEG